MKFSGIAILWLVAVMMAACGGGRTTVPADVAADSVVYRPDYATGFIIKGMPGRQSTVIESMAPWQGADSVTTRLLVLRGGEEVPGGFDGQVLRGPARRIVAMSSTHTAMLDNIGEVDRITGVSGLRFIANKHLQERRPADIGFDGNFDYELLLSLRPDLVLVYGVNGPAVIEERLRALGIPFMYVGDYLEQSPLGKAEWQVALGETVDCRERARARLDSTARRYNDLKERVAGAGAEHPQVMLNAPYQDAWFMPPVQSYMVRLIDDAGGCYVLPSNDTRRSVAVAREEALRLSWTADVWLNAGDYPDLKQLCRALPQWRDVPPVRNGRVYTNGRRSTAGGGNDFYESGVVHPDSVLLDLVNILHPALLPDSLRTMTYYRRLD